MLSRHHLGPPLGRSGLSGVGRILQSATAPKKLGFRYSSLEAGEDETGHIKTSSNQGVFFFNSKFTVSHKCRSSLPCAAVQEPYIFDLESLIDVVCFFLLMKMHRSQALRLKQRDKERSSSFSFKASL